MVTLGIPAGNDLVYALLNGKDPTPDILVRMKRLLSSLEGDVIQSAERRKEAYGAVQELQGEIDQLSRLSAELENLLAILENPWPNLPVWRHVLERSRNSNIRFMKAVIHAFAPVPNGC